MLLLTASVSCSAVLAACADADLLHGRPLLEATRPLAAQHGAEMMTSCVHKDSAHTDGPVAEDRSWPFAQAWPGNVTSRQLTL